MLYCFCPWSLRLNTKKRRAITDDQLSGAAHGLTHATAAPVTASLT
jgi:hypothetical protein